MARPYASEIVQLPETLHWALTTPIEELQQAVRVASSGPLIGIGSGGSLTAAHALVRFHRQFTGQIATISTPLEFMSEPLWGNVATWLLSAGGGNVDILASAKSAIARESRQVVILCGAGESKLARFTRQHTFAELLLYTGPVGKDGFLATNSLLGFVTVIARAYSDVFGGHVPWETAQRALRTLLEPGAQILKEWHAALLPVLTRHTTLVLHGADTSIGAIDLESKFTEAALGHVQIADYRNFAHGRHNWLAKQGDTSGVIALATADDIYLAERTLRLLPEQIPTALICLPPPRVAASIGSLIAALVITGWAGEARGIDPGNPGVAEFGRRLYHLPIAKSSSQAVSRGMSRREKAAIRRKIGNLPLQNLDQELVATWTMALRSYRLNLLNQTFSAIVLDYDGTVVETRHRFVGPTDEMRNELVRLLETGTSIGIATGRGASVRRDLQSALPKHLWSRVVIGYYNGAELAALDDDSSPDGTAQVCDDLAKLASEFRTHPDLVSTVIQIDRKFQITFESRLPMPESRLWNILWQIVASSGRFDIMVTRSSHSVDVLSKHASKTNIVPKIAEVAEPGEILRIGDRGLWPGNDFALLSQKFSLSVDECSSDPLTCWNLATEGQRGTAATIEYLSALEPIGAGVRFRKDALS